MIDSHMDDMIKENLALKEKVESPEQNLSKQITEKECLLETFNVFKNKSKEKENKYMEIEIDLEQKIKELNNIIFKVGQSAQTKAQRLKPTLYDGIVISEKHVAIPVIDNEETLLLEEESRSKISEKAKDPKVIAKKISHKPIDYEKLNRLTNDFGKRFTPQQELSAEQAFWLRIANSTIESSLPPVRMEVPSELPKVVQIVLWYLDSGCSKHMTGNSSQLMNFVSKFLGTVRFGNDQIARIMRYGDYQLGNVVISRVYYVEGLGHNLFSVGQFCDADLEVAFWKNTWFIRDLEGVDLILGSRDTNFYTISLDDMLKSSPICLLSKASRTKIWLWHRRLSHLNFDIKIFVGYGPAKKAFRIYNRRNRIISETILVTFDELTAIASEQFSSGHGLHVIVSRDFIKVMPEWSRHVTIVHQTKDLHTADYTQLYDFLKYNQKEVDELKAERLAKTQDPLALMASSNNPYNGLIGVQGNGNQNQIGNGNLMASRAEGNTAGQNGNQIRCYNCRGVGHYARNSTVRPRRRDAAYLQTQLLITQKEEAGIQLQAEDVEQGGETVEQHSANFEETRALYESLYQNIAIEVEKVNSVNRKLKETNADLTNELARFKNQERCFEIGQEKYDKLERCYQQSVYQEQCHSKKINALHLSS
nr:integrase, catalytic region, zinc finger, CCHC-type, peptidase aspartic, catalytic [Tanacetum cinerariifolium]